MSTNLSYNMFKIVTWYLFILLVVSGIACQDQDNIVANLPYQAQSCTHFLWPSSKNFDWVYARYAFPDFQNNDSGWTYKDFNSFGVDTDSDKISPITHSQEITDSIYITLNDTTYPCIVLDNGFKRPYFIGQDGVYNMGIFGEGDTVLKKGLYLPKEIHLNESWNGQLSFRQEGRFRAEEVLDRRCLSRNEILKTPAGDFECFVIKTRIREAEDYLGFLDIYEYFSPNIGLVAKVTIFIEPEKYWILQDIFLLKNYHTN